MLSMAVFLSSIDIVNHSFQSAEQQADDAGDELSNGEEEGKMKILLIEDDTEISDMLNSFLTAEGFEVVTAYDGERRWLGLRQISGEIQSMHLEVQGKSGFILLYGMMGAMGTKILSMCR